MLGDRGSCSGCECGSTHNRCKCNQEDESTADDGSNQDGDSSTNGHLRPPDMGQLKRKENLEAYTTALLRWSRLTATKKKDQGDVVLRWANSQYPQLARELDAELASKVAGNEEGVDLIKSTLETKFGRSVEADLRQSFHNWFHTVRESNESLIDYVSKFERNDFIFSKLGESLTPVSRH